MDGILYLELAVFHLCHRRATVVSRHYAMDPARECPVNKSLNRNRLFEILSSRFEIYANLFPTHISYDECLLCARWYVSNGMMDKVVEKLRRIARINRRNPDPRIYDAFVVSSIKYNFTDVT